MNFLKISLIITALCGWDDHLNAADKPFVPAGDDANLEIVGKYLAARETQKAALRGAEMEVRIEAKLPKLGREGALRAIRRTSHSDQVSYEMLDFFGDGAVKREVIARFLTNDSADRAPGAVAITPANYEFRSKSIPESGLRRVHVFQLKPRKKRVGLFKGELCVDAETGMPLRESGELVRSPSVFLKRLRFVRNYEMHGSVTLPKHIDITLETRLAGSAELSIEFTGFIGAVAAYPANEPQSSGRCR